MRLATFRRSREARLGMVWQDQGIDFHARVKLFSGAGAEENEGLDMRGFLAQGKAAHQRAEDLEAWVKKEWNKKPHSSLREEPVYHAG